MPDPFIWNCPIKVIGVGSGGCHAVNHMFRQGIKGVEFMVFNTDDQALEASPVTKKVKIGKTTRSNWAGVNSPDFGEATSLESIDEIREIFIRRVNMVFLVAALGGETGTGAMPVIANAAMELGILTVGIVTIPFAFEGERRRKQALEGILRLKDCVDSLLVIHNDRVRDVYGDAYLATVFRDSDEVMAVATRGIAEIISHQGYSHTGFADLRPILERSGIAVMGTGTACGKYRASQAIGQALNSSLTNHNNLCDAKNILLNIRHGEKEVSFEEIGEALDFILETTRIGSEIIWENTTDLSLGDSLFVTVIATGLEYETGLGEMKPDYPPVKR